MKYLWSSIVVCLLLAPDLAGADERGPQDSESERWAVYSGLVVGINVSYKFFDEGNPWQKGSHLEASGSGFFIRFLGKLHVLTVAHLVLNSAGVEVTAIGGPTVWANVKYIDVDSDLAILEVDEEGHKSFFEELQNPPEFSTEEILFPTSQIFVVGFPGPAGFQPTVLEATISKLFSMEKYMIGGGNNISTQISRPVNAGTSGGPVLNKSNHIVGVIFQKYPGEHGAYMIPLPVIQHFLSDLEASERSKKPYRGFPDIGVIFRPAPHMGVAVDQILGLSDAAGLLERGDIITEITYKETRYNVGYNGMVGLMVPKSKPIPVSASYLIRRAFVGDTIEFLVQRGKEFLRVPVLLKKRTSDLRLVPESQIPSPHGRVEEAAEQSEEDGKLDWCIYGGAVFQPLTKNYLKAFGSDWMTDSPAHLRKYYDDANNHKRFVGNEVVILNKVLAFESLVRGAKEPRDLVVIEVNGHKVQSMDDLFNFLSGHGGDLQEIKLLGENDQVTTIHIPRERAELRAGALSRAYEVGSPRPGRVFSPTKTRSFSP